MVDVADDLEAVGRCWRKGCLSKGTFKCWAKKVTDKATSATRVSPEAKASEQKKAKSVGELDKPANWAKGAVLLAARRIEKVGNGRQRKAHATM